MLDDEKFLASMSPEEKMYHFGKTGKAQKLDDAKVVVEEVSEESSTENEIKRKEKFFSDGLNREGTTRDSQAALNM